MRRRSGISAIGLATLLSAAPVGIGSNLAYANTCLSNGVCYYVSNSGHPNFKNTIHLTGQPRVRDYVTYHYNVRIGGGRQFELSALQGRAQFPHPGSVDISVQACRKRTLLRSLCTPWSTFKVY